MRQQSDSNDITDNRLSRFSCILGPTVGVSDSVVLGETQTTHVIVRNSTDGATVSESQGGSNVNSTSSGVENVEMVPLQNRVPMAAKDDQATFIASAGKNGAAKIKIAGGGSKIIRSTSSYIVEREVEAKTNLMSIVQFKSSYSLCTRESVRATVTLEMPDADAGKKIDSRLLCAQL